MIYRQNRATTSRMNWLVSIATPGHSIMSQSNLFHQGELRLQQRTGARAQIASYADRMIRDFIPKQHQMFYLSLSYLFVGATDQQGQVWATVLTGQAGFVQSPDPYTLIIKTSLADTDPLSDALAPGTDIAILGLDFNNRRRNRISGTVVGYKPGCLQIAVKQTFGNCPRYIHARQYEPGNSAAKPSIERFSALYKPAVEIISRADSFFVASHSGSQTNGNCSGADISYRGGQPGFVIVDNSNTLTVPDFAGNFHFNTLGNFELNPNAGLLFIDFEHGDILYLNGRAKVLWDDTLVQCLPGAERLWQFKIDTVIKVSDALPIRFQLQEYSPYVDMHSIWPSYNQAV
ncbi:pyridoxamine 5'-phosphate oxidase family protein [Neptunicella marina]|uniref:Pyridoxamine 5'-phosphate oxidase family protein n=1 Tax=Neptunicella marina TaxID=2125989 RepID=A0A8J6M0N0_9ALTE|nr:pyridoxamine 5'-phosphate oxidase family protein [Neptunicella marina]MBC3767304.1 pyridoxamine 5'-phosphate oxidase family protein [Neptunicella marina]